MLSFTGVQSILCPFAEEARVPIGRHHCHECDGSLDLVSGRCTGVARQEEEFQEECW